MNNRERRLVEAVKKDTLWNELNDLAGRIQQGKFTYPTDKNAKYELAQVVKLLQRAMRDIAPFNL
jgi:hypothetical protein